jgi:hypothetical protein
MLTGNTGYVSPNLHISAPYSSNGFVFVQWTYRRRYEDDKGRNRIEKMHSWKRMTLKRAQREMRWIIPCSDVDCKKPAVSLDHHWPYMSDYSLCQEHLDKED